MPKDPRIFRHKQDRTGNKCSYAIDPSSSIQTVLSVPESHRISLTARGLERRSYRRSGISPCPEDALSIAPQNDFDKSFFSRYHRAKTQRRDKHGRARDKLLFYRAPAQSSALGHERTGPPLLRPETGAGLSPGGDLCRRLPAFYRRDGPGLRYVLCRGGAAAEEGASGGDPGGGDPLRWAAGALEQGPAGALQPAAGPVRYGERPAD